jgi:hypothetical protein
MRSSHRLAGFTRLFVGIFLILYAASTRPGLGARSSVTPLAPQAGAPFWSGDYRLNGANRQVTALARDANGNIYAGGYFSSTSGGPANHVAKWNGNSWESLGSGMGGQDTLISALAVDQNGSLYVGGQFQTAGGVSVSNVAKWNGSSWEALGAGVTGWVHALAVDSHGNLYAGGEIGVPGVSSGYNLARWNGTVWDIVGGGVNAGVYSLVVDAQDHLYVGGDFTFAGSLSANRIANGMGLPGRRWGMDCLPLGVNASQGLLRWRLIPRLIYTQVGIFPRLAAYQPFILLAGTVLPGQRWAAGLPVIPLSLSSIALQSMAATGCMRVGFS